MRKITLISVLGLLIGLFGMSTAKSQSVVTQGNCGTNLTYVLLDDSTFTIYGSGAMTNYNYNTMPWYSHISRIKTVIIGDSVTSIGDCAFWSCSSLTSVTIPNSIKTIGSVAFYYCSSLMSITIPDSVASIGNNAFDGCNNLQTVNFNAINCISYGFNNPVFGNYTSVTTLNIGNQVKTIPVYAFWSFINLTSVTIPNSVTYIGNAAFGDCSSLTSITIPENVTTIGGAAFSGCSSLQTVNYNAINCTTMGAYNNYVFGRDTALKTLNIGNQVKTIPDYAFGACSALTSVIIPDSVASIGGLAFDGCSSLQTVNFNAINCTTGASGSSFSVFADCPAFTTLNIGNSVKTIPNYTFWHCSKLTSVTISDNVTSIGNNAFANCTSLQTVNYNAINCTTMGTYNNYVFTGDTALTTLNIGNQVRTIPNYAFYNCNKLTSVTIPDSVTSIGTFAFSGCSGLQTINYNAINCTVAYGFFYFEAMMNGANTTLTTVNIGNQVKTIPDYAFGGCTRLTSVTIPNSVTNIGHSAFNSCGLTSIIIPNSVDSVGDDAFQYCKRLKSAVLSDSITRIGDYTFAGCDSLVSIIIPNRVTHIGDYAFQNCKSLNAITIPNNVNNIGSFAFQGCTKLQTVTIPDSVRSIGQSAFASCDSLKSITSQAVTPPVLGSSVFYNVPTNIPVYIPCFTYNSYRTAAGWSSFKNFVISGSDTTVYDTAICYNTSYTDNNFTNLTQAKTYYTTLVSSTNCDSVICLRLIVYPSVPITYYSAYFCQRGTYTDNNFTNLTQPGYYYDTLQNINGCDSIVNLYLSYYSTVPITYYSASFCQGGSYTDANFTNLTKTGTYNDTLQNINGCDSIVRLTLYVTAAPISNYSASFCQGGSYTDNHFTNLTQPGYYYDTLQNVNGCDSIVRLYLSYYSTVPITYYSAYFCQRGTYTDNNFTNLTQPGYYYDTLQNINGCDSIVRLYLSYYSTVPITYYSASFCQGGSYTDNHFTNLTQPGYYYDTLQNINGCDSIVRLYLYVTAAPISNYSATVCQGGSYTDNHFSNLTQAGVYYDTLKTAGGCDSIVRLTLSYPISPVQQLCMISVDANNHNEVVWKELEEVVSYNIYREGTQIGNYDLVANVNYSKPNRWTDTISNAKTRAYRYKVSAIDTCGNESKLSDAHRTMHLTINAGQNNSWNLIWTPYEGTQYSTYNIYRAAGNKNSPLTLIGTMPAGNTSYSDFTAPNGNGYLYYMVEIVLNNPCVLTKSLSSIQSNIATNDPEEGRPTYTIQGQVTYNSSPLAGVEIQSTVGGSVVTNVAGEYTLMVEANSTATLIPKLTGYTFIPSYITCNNVTNNLVNQNFVAMQDETGIVVGANGIRPEIRVYPNPAINQLKITNYELQEGEVVEIYSVVGQTVGAYPCGRPETTIDISHLAKGMYYLKVGSQTVRFVKE